MLDGVVHTEFAEMTMTSRPKPPVIPKFRFPKFRMCQKGRSALRDSPRLAHRILDGRAPTSRIACRAQCGGELLMARGFPGAVICSSRFISNR